MNKQRNTEISSMTSAMTLWTEQRRSDWIIWIRDWDQSWAVWTQSLVSAKD